MRHDLSDSHILRNIFLSSSVNNCDLLAIIALEASNAFSIEKGIKPFDPPQENEGIKLRGYPSPNMLHDTPTTVPELNIVLIPHLV